MNIFNFNLDDISEPAFDEDQFIRWLSSSHVHISQHVEYILYRIVQ